MHNNKRNIVSKFDQIRVNTLGFMGGSIFFDILVAIWKYGRHLGLSNGQSGRFGELHIENIPANFHAVLLFEMFM